MWDEDLRSRVHLLAGAHCERGRESSRYTHTHTHTLTNAHACTHAHTHKCARMHTRTQHTHTHTHTHAQQHIRKDNTKHLSDTPVKLSLNISVFLHRNRHKIFCLLTELNPSWVNVNKTSSVTRGRHVIRLPVFYECETERLRSTPRVIGLLLVQLGRRHE